MNARAWQRMLSGRRLDLLDPSPLDVELSDIAHGLARVARWNGQTSGDHAFSVAQHSLVVEEIFRLTNRCDAQDCLMALLHVDELDCASEPAGQHVVGHVVSDGGIDIARPDADVEAVVRIEANGELLAVHPEANAAVHLLRLDLRQHLQFALGDEMSVGLNQHGALQVRRCHPQRPADRHLWRRTDEPGLHLYR